MSCAPQNIVIDGITISTSDFVNATELISNVSGDGGDPTQDAYEENIANGNNTTGRTGVQFPPSTQTTLPTPIPIPPQESNNTSGQSGNGVPVACIPWGGSYNEQLSPNFKVKDFTIAAFYPNQMITVGPYTPNVRFCNLMNLAMNIAEPMLAKFGPFRINSGIRNVSSTSGISQHITGEAVDIQFAGWTYATYWQNAQWIKDNIPYDQFIFEHSDRTGLAWYHLSYNKTGNRPASLATKVMTMYRNHYDSGLKRYG